jgi:hypothetical protein
MASSRGETQDHGFRFIPISWTERLNRSESNLLQSFFPIIGLSVKMHDRQHDDFRSKRRILRAGDCLSRGPSMCRNIKTLHNFEPPATDEEIRASALQFVRKLSGFARPSQANQIAFNRAVDQVTEAARELFASLITNAPPRDRAVEAAKARARSAERFHTSGAR